MPPSPSLSALAIEARLAAAKAYAPYSSFRVGAALLFKDGRIFHGCNVENASYGLTICAERCALWSAQAQLGDLDGKVEAIAVSCIDADPSLGDKGKMPCGACRQVMLELLGPSVALIVDGVGEFTVGELLPKGFVL